MPDVPSPQSTIENLILNNLPSHNQLTFLANVNKVLDSVKIMLLEKNRKYGNSVLEPINCFSKLSPIEGVNIRLDDKIKRLISGQADDTEDTELDIIGYLIIKQIIKMEKSEYTKRGDTASS